LYKNGDPIALPARCGIWRIHLYSPTWHLRLNTFATLTTFRSEYEKHLKLNT